MRIRNSNGSQIAYNTVYDNLRGIRFQDSHNGSIHNNTSYNNFESGIYLAAGSYDGNTGCTGTSVYDNSVYDNMNNGLLSIGGSGNSFTNNTVTGNWNAGVQMWSASEITVTGNTIEGNNHKSFNGIGRGGDARGGVTCESAAGTAGTFGCKVTNNTIKDNGRADEMTGVYVNSDVTLASEVTGNTFSGQSPDIVYGAGTVASNNTCSTGCDCNSGSVADCAGNCDTALVGTGVDGLGTDCAGSCGGSSVVDSCGVCDADSTNDNTPLTGDCDCAGVSQGNSVLDSCGTCDSDGTNDCVVLSTESTSTSELVVSYDSDYPIAGFEFNYAGLTLTGVSSPVLNLSIDTNQVIG